MMRGSGRPPKWGDRKLCEIPHTERPPALAILNKWLETLSEDKHASSQGSAAQAEEGANSADHLSDILKMECQLHAHRLLILGPLGEEAYEGPARLPDMCEMMLSSIARLLSSYKWTSQEANTPELELFLILHKHRPLIVKWLNSPGRAWEANEVLRRYYCISTDTDDIATWWVGVEHRKGDECTAHFACNADDLLAINACMYPGMPLPLVQPSSRLMEVELDTFTFTVCGQLLSALSGKAIRDTGVQRALRQHDGCLGRKATSAKNAAAEEGSSCACLGPEFAGFYRRGAGVDSQQAGVKKRAGFFATPLLAATSIALLSPVYLTPREAWALWGHENKLSFVALCRLHRSSLDSVPGMTLGTELRHAWHRL